MQYRMTRQGDGFPIRNNRKFIGSRECIEILVQSDNSAMEELREVLDGGSYKLLTVSICYQTQSTYINSRAIRNHKVNNRSLQLLSEADLQEIGITAVGPRKTILATIGKLRAAQSQAGENEGPRDENLRAILVNGVAFRNIVYNELDQNIVPKVKHLHEMVRILCGRFEKAIYDQQGYPSTNDQWQLAKQIVRAFPQLKTTRINENAPDESAFFWWQSGNNSGDHSGYIYHRVRNIAKRVPKELKKYSRPTKQ
nr:uncharacterized protein LOC115260729 [Aedes albopictus]